ncbi:hypothetical protein [Xenorhabdus griffiniae]|uniref:Condensation domain-containing protein n=1 Tax=Xenorhabdus griffiniae TaxID=351672 RepID=A0ABY9XME7_9GAMM|nr:hypothetical protein [Xenorhabdus griffiniae]MBD1228601.1 hypothetical protein [Xenorhabdus griffiniae]MBE8588126.1 hypothetical protein [Xenorhabdus griffiniae]WMV74095.1 hypothetical protein QL128_08950 [Xenorhabdus griffiniae]WNH03775.1 hypothetical protein QL112_008955 [Xenorhabdus griffiniae]
MNEIFEKLSQRQIYCLPFGNRLVIYGQWQQLDQEERSWLQQGKEQLLTSYSDSSCILPLPCWLNAMVLSEIISGDCSQFGLFYLAPDSIPPESSKLKNLIEGLYRTFPLLNSAVEWGDSGLELRLFTSPYNAEPEYQESVRYADAQAFIREQLQHSHSVFKRGMLRVVYARCGKDMRWGIWLHHLVADADFVQTLLSRVQVWLKTAAWPEPDLDFIQQIWVLEQQITVHRERLQTFWRNQKTFFSTLAMPPIRELLPESSLMSFTLHDEPQMVTRMILSLSRTLAKLNINGPQLAITPVTLRRIGRRNTGSGCYVNLLPILLDARYEVTEFDQLRLSWLEHAQLPQEEITSLCELNYRDAIVMINFIDTPIVMEGFQHHPEFRSRKPITITVTHGEPGFWHVKLTTRWGETFSNALHSTLVEELT